MFSTRLEKAEWNSSIASGDPEPIIETERKQQGKNLVLFAGADIGSQFIKKGLIDEYRVIINSVVLGSGTPLFKNLQHPLGLSLSVTQQFSCGNVLHIYALSS